MWLQEIADTCRQLDLQMYARDEHLDIYVFLNRNNKIITTRSTVDNDVC